MSQAARKDSISKSDDVLSKARRERCEYARIDGTSKERRRRVSIIQDGSGVSETADLRRYARIIRESLRSAKDSPHVVPERSHSRVRVGREKKRDAKKYSVVTARNVLLHKVQL